MSVEILGCAVALYYNATGRDIKRDVPQKNKDNFTFNLINLVPNLGSVKNMMELGISIVVGCRVQL